MDFSKLKRVEEPVPDGTDPEAIVKVIIKVHTPCYVPENVEVRSIINDTLYTANVKEKDIPAVERDPHVEAMSRSHALASYRKEE